MEIRRPQNKSTAPEHDTFVNISMPCGDEIPIPFPGGSLLTVGHIVRELAMRVPNHSSTFLLFANDSDCPVDGGQSDVEVDPSKDIALLFQTYKAFDTGAELSTAVRDWLSCKGETKSIVSERYGYVIGEWDTSNVTDMSGLFCGRYKFNEDISGWDTSKVTNMEDMFAGAWAFDGDLSGWDTSRVTNLRGTFAWSTAFDGDISRWDVSGVTDMSRMFEHAHAFDGDLGGWDTSRVTDMHDMFERATAFNGDVSGWDTSGVTNMCRMFFFATAFNGDISRWNTVAVTTMRRMFDMASAFNGDVSRWDTSSVTDMDWREGIPVPYPCE
jgi:surface protein